MASGKTATISRSSREAQAGQDTALARPAVAVLLSFPSLSSGEQSPFLPAEMGEPASPRIETDRQGNAPVSDAIPPAPPPHTPEQIMQRHTEDIERPIDRINVRLVLDETTFLDELLPVDVVRMLLSPVVNDCFVRIANGLKKPPRCKAHYLHTSFIREIMLLDALSPADGE